MKFYEFCVCRDLEKYSVIEGSFARKSEAIVYADKMRDRYPGANIHIKAHVYSKPLDAFDVGDYYLYSYDVH